MGRKWCQRETMHWKGLQPTSSIRRFGFLDMEMRTSHPLKNNWGSESNCVWTMFDESNSLSSTNLRKTIGFTSFGGTGEEHCDTTNDCWQEGGETLPQRWGRRSDIRYRRRKSWHKGRDNKVWPTLQLVNRSDTGSRNWWETKTRSSHIQRLRMQTGHERRGTPPTTLQAAGTLFVDVVCSASSAFLTAATTGAKKA